MMNHELFKHAPGREPVCFMKTFPRVRCPHASICGRLDYCLKDRGCDPYNTVDRWHIPVASYFASLASKLQKNSLYGKLGVIS